MASSRLDEMVARTPSSRDRVVDFLRAASICAVVFGHWFIALVYWERGVVGVRSAVGVQAGLWLGTWFFQVMPVFFFVGGFSNLITLDAFHLRGESTWAFVRSRVWRLLRPSLVFLGVWLVVQVVLHLTDTGAPTGFTLWGDTTLLRGMYPPAATLPFGPLWFLAVYLIVVAIAPATVWLHRRFGLWVPAVMIVVTIVDDVLGFGFGLGGFRYLNVATVLLLPHQLGHFYADGSMLRWPRKVFWGMVIVGLGGLVLLTNPWVFRPFGNARFDWFPTIGHYPKSLLGTDVEPISNAYPPTVCFMLASIWAVGAVMLLRPTLAGWLEHARPWKATIFVNSIIMTMFLWHMTAFLLAVLVLWPLGLGDYTDATLGWWLERVLWIAVPGMFLAGFVVLFGRFERPSRPRERAAGSPGRGYAPETRSTTS
ncbi:MAG TPA: acyltransferase [Actinomycetota bacterium]|nr:acyltransferase [Actinomycetota bacterium]